MSHGHILSFIPRHKNHKDDLKQRYKLFNIIKGLRKKQETEWTYDRHLKIIELECQAKGELGPISRDREIQKHNRKTYNKKKKVKNRLK